MIGEIVAVVTAAAVAAARSGVERITRATIDGLDYIPMSRRCGAQLARKTDDGSVAARDRAFRPTRTAGGRDGLIGRFLECVEARQGSAWARAPDVDLAALLAAYGRIVSRGSRGKPRGA